MNKKILLSLCSLYGKLQGERARYSHATEANFAHMTLEDKLWWGYKCYIRQVERAQKGKGIEEHFEKQNLAFDLPEGFMEEGSVTFSAGGDLLSSPFITPENTKHVWDDIADYYFDADIVYANLESPVTRSAIAHSQASLKATPAMNNSVEMLEVFHRSGKGVNLFSTANNHSMDMGEDGLIATLDILDEMGCAHVGTARTQAERDDVLVIEKNGIRIAFLSYTFSLNGKMTPEGKSYMANYIRLNTPDFDASLIEQHVRSARIEKKADFVIALVHWSLEFELYPVETVMSTAKRLAAMGIDLIVGNHSHCIQPIERIKAVDPYSSREKDCLVVYALGDLLHQNGYPGNFSLANLIKVRLVKGSVSGAPAAFLTDFTAMPKYTFSRLENGKYVDHRLLDIRRLANNLRAGENPYCMSEAEQKEVFRLEAIMNRVLGPAIASTAHLYQ